MREITVRRLSVNDASILSDLLTADDAIYSRYFTPFSTEKNDIAKRLLAAIEDRYWAIWMDDSMTGFFMLRGFDQAYTKPAFGVYIAKKHAGKGLSNLALGYCICWCKLNAIQSMMLKVHPENIYAMRLYKKFGFEKVSQCERTGHIVMEKAWEIFK